MSAGQHPPPVLFPPQQRRRIARRKHWMTVPLWVVAVFFGLVAAVLVTTEGTDVLRVPVPAAVVTGLVLAAGIGYLLAVMHRHGAAWSRAADVAVAERWLSGTITSISHHRATSDVGIDVDGVGWRCLTSDRADQISVPGDPVTVELYTTSATALGAYRNDRTGHVRAVTVRGPE